MNLRVAYMPIILAALSGCDSSDEGGSGGSTSATSSGAAGGGAGGMGAGSGVGGAGATSSDAGHGPSDGGGGAASPDGMGRCELTCSNDADCCPDGLTCDPTGGFPYNFVCQDGICADPFCVNDAECVDFLSDPTSACLELHGEASCFSTCEKDDDCAYGTCSGVDDHGVKYCSSGGCTSDDECFGTGKCDVTTGICGCTSAEDCTADFVNTCVMP